VTAGRRKVALVVCDSLGVGALPDAGLYGDEGSDTLGHVAEAVGGLHVPNLQRWGLGAVAALRGVPQAREPEAWYGRMAEMSPGKDTTTGHWEMMGLILDRPFPVYPDGFPAEVVDAFERAIGREVIGNRTASGTEIIEELGEEHVRSGRPILYASADSVFQLAAHVEVVALGELYRWCEIARGILQGANRVSRVIARPFSGMAGAFRRTGDRRDFSIAPVGATDLDRLAEADVPVVAVGKVGDIFAYRGIHRTLHTQDNSSGVAAICETLSGDDPVFCFANLGDFDSLYGHRNDPAGYAAAVEDLDGRLPDIEEALSPGDVLILTGDHGCDPTTASTDHSREYVPVLAKEGSTGGLGGSLGSRSTFADVGATVCELFGVGRSAPGTSFASCLRA